MSVLALEMATVVERSTPMAGAVELVLYHPPTAASTQPGQFVQLAVSAPHTLLRRPYSVAWTDPASGRLGLIFNVVGAGSAWLSARHEGHELDLIGPLGRGFDLTDDGPHFPPPLGEPLSSGSQDFPRGEGRDGGGWPAVCVAGGLGIAVFPGVVQALRARGRPVLVLHGARTAAQLLPVARFAGAEVRYATDDGSAGHHGSVVGLLQNLPQRFGRTAGDFPPPLGEPFLSGSRDFPRGQGKGGGLDIFACGPTPMLQALIDQARRLELPLSTIQIALETPMGCGMGTCLGCAAPRRGGGYLLTCQDGPCVRADHIDWERMTDAFHD